MASVTTQQFNRACRAEDAGGAQAGYCAKGVANILEDLGVAHTRNHAYTWKNTLPQNGWVKLEGVTPENAPPGAVLIFDQNPENRGKSIPKGASGGKWFGHAEIVTEDKDGNRHYVSDKSRNNWGGSVPGNFVGVYVHPDLKNVGPGDPLPANMNEILGTDSPAFQQNASASDKFNIAALLGADGAANPLLAILNIFIKLFTGVDVNAPQPEAPAQQAQSNPSQNTGAAAPDEAGAPAAEPQAQPPAQEPPVVTASAPPVTYTLPRAMQP